MPSFKNINFLSQLQYAGVTNPSFEQIWAVETPSIVDFAQDASGNGYAVFSNDFCIMWGQVTRATTGGITVTLPREDGYNNANYRVYATLRASDAYTSSATFPPTYTQSITNTTFVINANNASTTNIGFFDWFTIGQIS